MLLGNMRIWSANAMNGAVFVLSNLPCIRMGYVRQLLRLFGPCFRVVNLLWTLQWHISAIVFPRKELQILFQDGAGIYSVPDWPVPPATARPLPGNLRQSLLQWLSERRVPIRLQHHVRSCKDSPLFSTDEVEELRTIFCFAVSLLLWSYFSGLVSASGAAILPACFAVLE